MRNKTRLLVVGVTIVFVYFTTTPRIPLHEPCEFCKNSNTGAGGTSKTQYGSCQLTDCVNSVVKEAKSHCDDKHVAQFSPDPYWEHYQFADFFKGILVYQREGDFKKNWLAYNSSFPGSLEDEYHKASVAKGTQSLDYELLQEIIRRRAAKKQLPSPNTLVIHLRLGDVVDAAFESVEKLLLKQHYFYRENKTEPWKAKRDSKELVAPWNAYVRPLATYSGIDLVRQYKSVVIMGSAHMGQIPEEYSKRVIKRKSCLYAGALQAYLQRFKIKVTLRVGKPPDEDMVFASQAKGYFKSGGGFSNITAELVKRFGGKVIE